MPNMKRVSFTLPPNVVDELDYISRTLGVSKSSIVGELLGKGLLPLAEILRALATDTTPCSVDVVRRLRGASADQIRGELDHLREVFDSIEDPSDFELDPCYDRPAGCSCDYSSGERIAPRAGCLVHYREGGS